MPCSLPFARRRRWYGGLGSGSHRGVACAVGGSRDHTAGDWRAVRSWVPGTPSRTSEPPSPLPPSFRSVRLLHPPLPPPLSARRSGLGACGDGGGATLASCSDYSKWRWSEATGLRQAWPRTATLGVPCPAYFIGIWS
ncbi:hypothetical protein VPH35_030866 [Triticum aestivum]